MPNGETAQEAPVRIAKEYPLMSCEQVTLVSQFYNHTCFEFMCMGEVRAGDPAGFVELWNRNIAWLDDVVAETEDYIGDYERQHADAIEAAEIDDDDEEEE